MKKLIVTFLLITSSIFANEQSDLLNNCIDIFIKMDKATINFQNELTNEYDISKLKTLINTYNDNIVLFSMNRLAKHSKSKDEEIKKISKDLSNLLSELTRNNYQFLEFLTNDNPTKKQIENKSKELINKNKFASNSFNQITLGLINSILKENNTSDKKTQYLKISKKDKLKVSKKIKSIYKKSVNKGLQKTLRDNNTTAFEKSLVMIYDFFNIKLNWIYLNS